LAIRTDSLLGGRVINFCTSKELCSDHLDIISSEEDSFPCLDTVWNFLQGDELTWDVLDFSLLSTDSAIMRHIAASSALEWEISEKSTAPYISLAEGFDTFMAGFNGKHRYTLRKKLKKLSEQGFSYKACERDKLDEGIQVLFELHKLRAANKGIVSTFCGQRLLTLHKAAAKAFAGKGRLWLRFLESDEKKIGAFYGFELGGKLFYYQFGIDPEWEPYSPGTVLMYKVIEEAFSKGLSEFDFLRGSEAYKSDWTNDKRTLYSMKSYRNTVRGSFSRTVIQSKGFLKKNIRRLIS